MGVHLKAHDLGHTAEGVDLGYLVSTLRPKPQKFEGRLSIYAELRGASELAQSKHGHTAHVLLILLAANTWSHSCTWSVIGT